MPITMQCGGKPKNNPTLTANNSGLKEKKINDIWKGKKPSMKNPTICILYQDFGW